MPKKKRRKGFTLIELLVVIAIIGILAGIVLVSLGGARNRAKDGRIIADMNQVRSTAEVFAGNNSDSYTGLEADPSIVTLKTDITSTTLGGTLPNTTLTSINTDGKAYCALAKLNSGHYWCVDNLLNSYDAGTTAPTACAATCVAGNSCKCK